MNPRESGERAPEPDAPPSPPRAQPQKSKVPDLARKAAVHIDRQEYGEARKALDEALALDPQNRDLKSLNDRLLRTADASNKVRALVADAETQLRAGEYNTARKSIEDALALSPTDHQANSLKTQLPQVSTESENTARELRGTASNFIARGERNAALKALTKAMEMNPYDTDARSIKKALEAISPENQASADKIATSKAALQLSNGEYDMARQFIDEALKLDPFNAVAMALARQLSPEADHLAILNEAAGTTEKASLCKYKTTRDDSLSAIAGKVYPGRIGKYLFYSLAKINDIEPPGKIKPGKQINIPAADCGRLSNEDPFAEAMKALGKGDRGKAFRLLKNITAKEPNYKKAQIEWRKLVDERDDHFLTCNRALRASEISAALRECNAALDIDPTYEPAQQKKKEIEGKT